MKTDPFKGIPVPQDDETSYANSRHKAIYKICEYLSTAPDEIDQSTAYNLIKDYQTEYGRWSYSDITNYIFDKKNDDDLLVFTNNLSSLQNYAAKETGIIKHIKDTDPDSYEVAKRLEIALDKFLDHSNLAQRQKTLLSINDENFARKFEIHAKPYSDKLETELNKGLISLVSIFTALSFIVFGGISSLDNLFEEAGVVPIIELVIVGCIWSFCILNLVFSFVYLVSKLTKIPIRVVDDPKASLTQKYPFWVWSNYFLLFILAAFCFLYYIDYSNSGGWLINFSQENSVCSMLIGVGVLISIFGFTGWILLGKPMWKKNK